MSHGSGNFSVSIVSMKTHWVPAVAGNGAPASVGRKCKNVATAVVAEDVDDHVPPPLHPSSQRQPWALPAVPPATGGPAPFPGKSTVPNRKERRPPSFARKIAAARPSNPDLADQPQRFRPRQGGAGHRAETVRIGANKSRRSPEGYWAAQHPCGRLTGRVGPPVKATAQSKVGFHASALSRQ